MKLKILAFLFMGVFVGCNQQPSLNSFSTDTSSSELYSMKGREHQVQFEAIYHSNETRIEDLRIERLQFEIEKTTQFLFGPLTHRSLAGVQKGARIKVMIEKAYLDGTSIMVPYQYQGVWLIHEKVAGNSSFQIPLPYSVDSLRTANWKDCTEADPEHGTWSFFWYYWDPQRSGCEHKLGTEYQNIDVQIGAETVQTKTSFPEYSRMIRDENGTPTLAMTFAFGYTENNFKPQPFIDNDPGMREFQKFYAQAKTQLVSQGWIEKPVLQNEINGYGDTQIGSQFIGMKNGVLMKISILAAAGVDQMDLFADSYARKHEGFFGWFGHSRVGSGFDANLLKQKLSDEPEKYSITHNYQLVYWAGCNSYSYYTQPFFELKAQLDPSKDPAGTQNLDLISNALPSWFSFNALNAQVLLQALLNFESPTSYQRMINQIEQIAQSWGARVLVSVLGDEDNASK